MGVNGMATSAHPLASLAGVRMMMAGGNAFDAAVAVASTLNVCEPFMSGAGGVGLALAYVAAEDRVRALNFSGRMPAAADPEEYEAADKDVGIKSALVPGNVAGWLTLHETYGKLDRERLFEPAIGYAENGTAITFFNAKSIGNSVPRLSQFPSKGIFIKNGKGPGPGERVKQPQLAESLRAIARGGKDEFYRGELAARLVKGAKELGGQMTEEDLATYDAEWCEPIGIGYRDYEIFSVPPNSTGFQLLETLKIMEGFEGQDLIFQHPETVHSYIEAVKLAVTDRIKWGGDPDHVKAPLGGLLSSGYAEKQRSRIDRDSAAVVSGEEFSRMIPSGSLKAGSADEFDGGMTTHFAVADSDGNVVSVTQTLGGGFGSAVAPGDTGLFLNNMAHWFDLEEGAPNRLAGGKRVDFCLAPTQTFKDGRFHVSLGTPGSWGILQTTPQFVMNFLDFGMNVQEAIEAPRLRVFEERRVVMEERFPYHVRAALAEKGHDIELAEPFSTTVGGAQGIMVDHESGTFQGGADPRRDGVAIGW
jgi:gamma-glutamyltranspeptidase/glutathione hydrolase